MSASPLRAKKSSSFVGLSLGSDPNRVIEPDESLTSPAPVNESQPAVATLPAGERLPTTTHRWFSAVIQVTLFSVIVAGILAGAFAVRIFFALWDQVTAHGQQLAEHQATMQRLRGTQHSMAELEGQLKSLGTSTSTLLTLLAAQEKRLDAIESRQTGLEGQMQRANTRWQQQWSEWRHNQNAPAATRSAPTTPGEMPSEATASSAVPLPPTPVASASAKHEDSFRPELKPHPNAQAHLADTGMIVWLTPRPGYEKPVPTSVISYVRGLGFLVHDWDDNQHYFITESGNWIADQR